MKKKLSFNNKEKDIKWKYLFLTNEFQFSKEYKTLFPINQKDFIAKAIQTIKTNNNTDIKTLLIIYLL